MAEPLLQVEGLKSGYGEAVVVQGVSLSLPQGQSLALLGRNGTGKTTLLNTLVGVTRRHAGRIVLAGVDLTALPPHQRAAAGIGWVPQERNHRRAEPAFYPADHAARRRAGSRQHRARRCERRADGRSRAAGSLVGGREALS